MVFNSRSNSIRVETTDGYCNKGKVKRIDCPETDFRLRGRGLVGKRQEPPVNSQKQCYGDLLLKKCDD